METKNKIRILGVTRIDKCEYCRENKDLRPYGENQKMICYDCGMKPENKKVTRQELDKLIKQELNELKRAVHQAHRCRKFGK